MSDKGGASKKAPSGPPYAPTTAQLGGMPTSQPDDPICVVLMGLFLLGALTHMVIFQVNRKRDHKFLFSVMLFIFCLARVLTLGLRLVWSAHPHSVPIAIAAGIFVQAGVLLLFIVNLIFTQRIIRSYHPSFGWSPKLSLAFKALYACIAVLLVMVITASVHSFYTLDIQARLIDRDILLFASTFLALLAFLPIPITILAIRLPRRGRPEKFGQGRYRTKLSLLFFSSGVLTIGAAFRCGVNFSTPRPLNNPAWYHSKPCFYCFIFLVELLVVYAFAITRFDRRFHVPNGSSAPGHYSGNTVGDPKASRPASTGSKRPTTFGGQSTLEVNREADVFGNEGFVDLDAMEEARRASEWEARATEELEKVVLEHL